MNKPTIIIIVFITLAALVVWQYFMPALDKVLVLREDLKLWQGKLGETQVLSQKLETLKQKYEAMSDQVDRVNQALPKGIDTPGLLVQMEQLASQNGLILNDVTLTMPVVPKAKKATVLSEDGTAVPVATPKAVQKSALPAGVKNVIVNLSLSGSQDSFGTFLSALEENLRIMDIVKIDFSEKGSLESVQASKDFKISFNTYFR